MRRRTIPYLPSFAIVAAAAVIGFYAEPAILAWWNRPVLECFIAGPGDWLPN